MENHLTYRKFASSGQSLCIFSIPWSYLVTGIALFIIGILDFIFLGYLIGHPGEEIIGEYIGQGIAVYLGGVSFAWTIGLVPLITGFIIVVYCIYASKQVILSRTENSFIIQERRLLFPFITELRHSSIRKIDYTNKGLQLRHVWVMLFIPMGIRILQFGVPLFNEHLAHDNILPVMMVVTAVIDIVGALLMVIVPTHTLSFESEQKLYTVNFLPVISTGNINRTLVLSEETESHHKGEEKISYSSYFHLIGGLGMIIMSIIGLSLEFLWGTDLSMIGVTYGIYLVLRVFQNKTPIYFTKFSKSTGYFPETDRTFRKLTLIDITAISLLIYFSTLEFLWGWVYFNPNWLTILEMSLTTVIWLGMIFWNFLYITVPLPTLKTLKLQLKENPCNRLQFIFRLVYMVILVVLGLIVAF